MDWRLLARGVLLYGVVAAGVTVLLVALVTSGEFPLFALMLVGMVCVLFAVGLSDVRTTHDLSDGGGAHEMYFPGVDASLRRRLPYDWLAVCYGVGLAVFSFAGMTIVA